MEAASLYHHFGPCIREVSLAPRFSVPSVLLEDRAPALAAVPLYHPRLLFGPHSLHLGNECCRWHGHHTALPPQCSRTNPRDLHLTSFVLSFIFQRTEKVLFRKWPQFPYL